MDWRPSSVRRWCLGKLSGFGDLISLIGFPAAMSWLVKRGRNQQSPVHAQTAFGQIAIRPHETDFAVAIQVLVERQYEIDPQRTAALRSLARDWRAQGQTPVIVDGGANVGYAALYFSTIFPEARVLAVEPGPETFKALATAVAETPAITAINGALWSHNRGVSLFDRKRNCSWATRVDDVGEDQALTRSFTLPELLGEVPNARLLILKLDIEGAEREVVAAAPEVVRDAPCILIEAHDGMYPGKGCLTPLFAAIAGREVDTMINGENLMIYDSSLGKLQVNTV